MTRLAIACTGLGYTLGIATIALFGENATVSLSFSAGIGSAGIILGIAVVVILLLGKRLNLFQVSDLEHSQTRDSEPL